MQWPDIAPVLAVTTRRLRFWFVVEPWGGLGFINFDESRAESLSSRTPDVVLREIELAAHKVGVTAICPGMINTAIVADARMAGALTGRKAKATEAFKKGMSPARVADAILDAVRDNPAVRTVGRDAWVLHQLIKLAPGAAQRLGGTLQRRMG
ncbi:MAG: hypothetical protein ABIY55_14295 [Kofleriaceae bacterium]